MKYLFLPLLISSLIIPAWAQQSTYPLWKGLTPGPYQVGFTTTSYWRHASLSPGEDEKEREGDAEDSPTLPVQVSIWYPSQADWSQEKALAFVHYFYLTEQKNDLKPLSEERKAGAMDIFKNFSRYGLKRELTPETIEEIRNSPTAAMPGALPADGPFPVLLAGHDGGIWKMSTLCEYLASHGYVIISTGPVSPTYQLLRSDPGKAIRRRMEVYSRLEEVVDTMSFANPDHTGLLGLNFDGLTSLMYQMETGRAGAVASIDGWEGKNNGVAMIRAHFDFPSFSVPYLEIQQDESPENESLMLNNSVFDSLDSKDAYSLVIRDIGHSYLTGNLVVLPGLPRDIDQKNLFWYNAVRLFFDAHLTGDKEKTDQLLSLIRSQPEDYLVRQKVR